MHLHKFTTEQKLAFLGLTHQLVRADGAVHRNESAYLPLLLMEMNLERDVSVPESPRSELMKAFTHRHTQVWLLLELLGVCYVDDEMDPVERDFVQDISRSFGFSDEDFEQMDDIVQRTRALFADVQVLASKA